MSMEAGKILRHYLVDTLFESLKTSSSNKFEVINELKNRGWSVEELYNSEKISKEDYEKYK